MKPRPALLILALCTAALNLRPGITSVAPVLDTLEHTLGMSPPLASLLTSVPVLCMGVFAPVGVAIAARAGVERVLAASVALIAVGTALRLFTHTAWFLLVTAFLIGIGIATGSPLLTGFAKTHFPSRVFAMISLYTLFMVFGSAAGAGLTVPLANALHGSWRAALAVWALFGVLALAPWWQVLRQQRQVHPRHSASAPATGADADVARAALSSASSNLAILPATSGAPAAGRSASLPWNSGRAWVLTLCFGLMSFMFYCITAWLPPAVQASGASQSFAGAVGTVFMLVQIPVTLLIPALIGWVRSRGVWLVTFSLFELAGLALFVFAHANPLWVAAVIGIGAGGLFPLALLLPVDYTESALEASSWTAMEQSVGYLIGATGPFVVGFIRDRWHGFTPAFQFLMAVVVAMVGIQVALTAPLRFRRTLPNDSRAGPMSEV